MMSNETNKSTENNPKITLKAILPFLILLVIIALFSVAFFLEPKKIPSALIDKPAPVTNLPMLEGLMEDGVQIAGIDDNILRSGKISLVNIWASWCTPCRKEHPILLNIAKNNQNIQMIGLNYKDKAANALKFLRELENPYDFVGTDEIGRELINWGVYGVPETFLIDSKGIIRFKFVGPLNQTAVDEELLPALNKILNP